MRKTLTSILGATILACVSACSPTAIAIIGAATASGSKGSKQQTQTFTPSFNCLEELLADRQPFIQRRPRITSQQLTILSSPTTRQEIIIGPPTGNAFEAPNGSIIDIGGGRKFFLSGGNPGIVYEASLRSPTTSTRFLDQQFDVLGKQTVLATVGFTGVAGEMSLIQGTFVSASRGSRTDTLVNGRNYRVDVLSSDSLSRTADYLVNGERSGVMIPGQVFSLSDGTNFIHAGRSDVGVRYALRARKIEIFDDDVRDDVFLRGGLEYDGVVVPHSRGMISANISVSPPIINRFGIVEDTRDQTLLQPGESYEGSVLPVDVSYERLEAKNFVTVCIDND